MMSIDLPSRPVYAADIVLYLRRATESVLLERFSCIHYSGTWHSDNTPKYGVYTQVAPTVVRKLAIPKKTETPNKHRTNVLLSFHEFTKGEIQ